MFKPIKINCISFAFSVAVGLLVSHGVTLAADEPAKAVEAPADGKAATEEKVPEAYIPFANNGGVLDWQIVNENTVLIQDIHRKWYKAKLQGFVYGFGFNEYIGFVTSPGGTLERLSSLIIRGRHYPILSLTRTDPPPKPQKNKPQTQPEPKKQEPADNGKVV